MVIRLIGVLGILFLLGGCSKEVPIEQGNVSENPELQTYLDRFVDEAALRGISIDLGERNLTYAILEIEEENVAGYCQYHNQVATDIVIDRTFFFEATDNWREMVIFHELGHCVLYRNHIETSFNNGACTSIMRSGTGGCSDAYSANTREYYLDELFRVN